MKFFSVEIRTTYKVRAASKEEALQAVGTIEDNGDPEMVEYVIREGGGAPSSSAQSVEMESHGLTKPLYTVAEAALVLGISTSAMYEKTSTGGIQTVRLGKRSIRIPKAALARVLNGDKGLEPPSVSKRPQRREVQRRHVSILHPRKRKSPKPRKDHGRDVLNLSEASVRLGVTATQLRNLLDRREIYYVEEGNRRFVPRKAIELFMNGRPPIALVEENIKGAKALGNWDEDDERAAAALRKLWKTKRR